jgi:hypothetical protein
LKAQMVSCFEGQKTDLTLTNVFWIFCLILWMKDSCLWPSKWISFVGSLGIF